MKKIIKKYGGIILSIIIAIILTIITYDTEEIFVLNVSNIINIFLILIGFAFTCYTFIYGPLTNIITKSIEKGIDIEQPVEESKKTLKSVKEDILFIFVCVIIISFCEFAYKYNFPCLIDTSIYSLMSLKKTILNFICMMSIVFSIYSFIDISKSVFTIVENSFGLLKNLDTVETEDEAND